MLIGYMRASGTDTQIGNLQRIALLAAGVDPTRLYENHASGKHAARPGFDACIKGLRPGNTLVAWRVDRLGRDLRHLVKLAHDLTGRGVGLRVLVSEGTLIDTTAPEGPLVTGLFAALAEFERERSSECVRPGLPATRARGRHGGRPFKMSEDQLRQAQRAMAQNETSCCAAGKRYGNKRAGDGGSGPHAVGDPQRGGLTGKLCDGQG